MKTLSIINSYDFILIDDEDYDRLLVYKYYLSFDGKSIRRSKGFGLTIQKIPVSVDVLQCDSIILIDHKDRNVFNNQKFNLRFCSLQENARNKSKIEGSSSKYKGVCWDKKRFKWVSRITINRKAIHLGYFLDEIEAAKIYDIKAKELFGDFAVLNFNEY
jgi:hypothetical protein